MQEGGSKGPVTAPNWEGGTTADGLTTKEPVSEMVFKILDELVTSHSHPPPRVRRSNRGTCLPPPQVAIGTPSGTKEGKELSALVPEARLSDLGGKQGQDKSSRSTSRSFGVLPDCSWAGLAGVRGCSTGSARPSAHHWLCDPNTGPHPSPPHPRHGERLLSSGWQPPDAEDWQNRL
eukprot:bmy_08245T0